MDSLPGTLNPLRMNLIATFMSLQKKLHLYKSQLSGSKDRAVILDIVREVILDKANSSLSCNWFNKRRLLS